ncbi:hypothetical protein B0T14DRAFT_198639 [Immersiella caudata]|uniref:Uncharacterized protein n=1 Tax=Immersiella caudata TaxID=314043 RepID=A0AA39WP74_9PEZI|nr:hypothetical protein B0T14DRAFT_198639 [Immersiella caudata]
MCQRRERGRLAQRAFRRRQIDTIRELREENQALRDAIDEISRAAAAGPAHTHNRQSQLQAAIQNAFRVAGLDASLTRSLTDPGEDDDSDPPPGTPGFPQPQHHRQGLLEGGTIDPNLDFMSLGAPLLPTTAAATTSANIYSQLAAPTSPLYPHQTPSEASSGGRMSPRFSYGLWFEPDRAIRIVHPPHDIVPYIGESMRSLAGTIFWTGMGFSLGAFKTLLTARYRGVVLDDLPGVSSPDHFDPVARDDPAMYTYANDDTDDTLSLSVFRHAQPKRRQPLLHQHPPSRIVVVGGPDDEVLDQPHEDELLDDDNTYLPSSLHAAAAAAAEYAGAAAEFAAGTTTTDRLEPHANQPFSAVCDNQTPSQRQSPQSQPSQSPQPPPLTPSKKHKRYHRRVQRASRIIQRMFSPTIRGSSEKTVYDIIHARFTWRTKGWIAGDHPGRDPEGPMRLFSALLREPDHPAAYGEAHLWMTPVEIEGYLSQRLRMTPAGWVVWKEAIAGRGDTRRIQMLNRLVDLFVLNVMCFGDGPRWRTDWVAKWTEQWIEEVAVGPAGVGLWF